MKVWVAHGTPKHLDAKTYTLPSTAKNFLVGKISDREKWGERHTHKVRDEARAIRREVSEINVQALPVGQERSWSTTDDATGVQFVWKMKVIER